MLCNGCLILTKPPEVRENAAAKPRRTGLYRGAVEIDLIRKGIMTCFLPISILKIISCGNRPDS